jgi:hypothetical protein
MGMILDTEDDVLGLEERRESLVILDLKRKYMSEFAQSTDYKVEKRPQQGDHYTYAVAKRGSLFIDCGTNELKAEQIAAAMNTLDDSKRSRHLSDHIFAYQDGEIEISKAFLRKLVLFFDNAKHRKLLEER